MTELEICNLCGLPKNLCACKAITKEQQKIKIRVTRKRFGKLLTEIEGLEDKETAKQMGKELKRKFACGGTFKDGKIELQGRHTKDVKKFLINQGYKEELIDDR